MIPSPHKKKKLDTRIDLRGKPGVGAAEQEPWT